LVGTERVGVSSVGVSSVSSLCPSFLAPCISLDVSLLLMPPFPRLDRAWGAWDLTTSWWK
jgi:hypothetical protein